MRTAAWLSLFCLAWLVSWFDASAGEQLIFSSLAEPNTLSIEIQVDGAPFEKRWDDYFARLLAYLDRNGDGRLDRVEANRAPSPLLVIRHLQGDFDNVPDDSVSWPDLRGARKSEHVGVADLADYYRRHGLGRVALKALRRQDDTAERLTATLLVAFGDQRGLAIAPISVDRATVALRQLDVDGDERLSVAELLDRPATTAVETMQRFAKQPLATLAPAADDAGGELIVRLASVDSSTQSLEQRRRLFAKKQSKQRPSLALIGSIVVNRGDAIIRLAVASSISVANFATARESLVQEFETADQYKNGALDDTEMGESSLVATWRALAKIVDADKTLNRTELNRYLDVQASAAAHLVVVTVADRGPGLFSVLDTDGDGRLSLREITASWTVRDALDGPSQMAPWDADRDGRITLDEIPRRWEVTFSIGAPRTAPSKASSDAKPGVAAPAWFLALDGNGDGDISPREFIGRGEDFRTLDKDGNGLLDAAEAATTIGPPKP
jgi:hypothetical protein